jgi:hypothetical protein
MATAHPLLRWSHLTEIESGISRHPLNCETLSTAHQRKIKSSQRHCHYSIPIFEDPRIKDVQKLPTRAKNQDWSSLCEDDSKKKIWLEIWFDDIL